MFEIKINGKLVQAEAGTTILQACQDNGIEIPHFCYHERLSIAGNCRMCLVELENAPKPIASCAMAVSDGMAISTNTETVRKAREGVMEFLLINHPLDCPICDQGGECDLQDQAVGYGRDATRFSDNKRAVVDKNFGPLIQTYMTRCIHCTRCVRFMEEVAGTPHLGGLWRGEDMEIISLIEGGLESELSGNLIDLCPVGALTSKPYEFTARSWELNKTETIDVLDGVGSNIRVDTKGKQVMRILPRLNEDVNQEWIGDKTRFAYDGLRRQRLDRPYCRDPVSNRLEPVAWATAFEAIRQQISVLNGNKIGGIAGNLCDCESMLAFKDLLFSLGCCNIDCRQDGAALPPNFRAGYLFNSTIAGIDESDLCLLIGSNPRLEAPIINARLRQRWLRGDFSLARIGEPADLTYAVSELGAGAETLFQLASGTHDFCKTIQNSKKPMLILGQGPLTRTDGPAIMKAARALASRFGFVTVGWNGFNVLHTAAARVGGMDLGLTPTAGGMCTREMITASKTGNLKALYLLGADEIDLSGIGEVFLIYQGHHGDQGAQRANVVLPGAAYTEKHGYYVNTEGRLQQAYPATEPPGEAKEDWTIIRALSEVLGHTLGYNNINELRKSMIQRVPYFSHVGAIAATKWLDVDDIENIHLSEDSFRSAVYDYFMTDPISRNSEIMAECSRRTLVSSSIKKMDGQ